MAAQGDREDKKLVIQRSQLRQHGEFWHVSVSERQKLHVPFLRTVLPPEVGESARAMASTARQKRSYLHHQGEFQHCTVGIVHDSDHKGVVRIFVGHSYHSNELFILYYIILRGATALLVAVATPRLPRRSEANYCNLFQLTHMPRGSVDRDQWRPKGRQDSSHNLASMVSYACKRQFKTAITAVWSESSCAFPKNCTATGSRWSAQAMAANGETKVLISPPPR